MAMRGDARAVLSPLLTMSYVFGAKIIEYPVGHPRLWLSLLYILLVWLLYYFLLWWTLLQHTNDLLTTSFGLDNSMAILSVVLGIYNDKKYRACLNMLAMVDDTLEKIGTKTKYEKLYTEMLLTIFGWFMYIICVSRIGVLWCNNYYGILYCEFLTFLCEYSCYINVFDDLIFINTLRYIELKFKQINKYLRMLQECNEREIEQAWEHSTLLLHQNEYPKSTGNKYATWVIMHLHLELCKICRELNSIFGLQMTIKMGAYFTYMALELNDFFDKKFLWIAADRTQNVAINIMNITSIILNIFRLFIINYMCEKVCVQARATGDIMNGIPYSTYNVVVRENISQFLLQISLKPLKFYGLGLFQFGLKYFYGFSASFTTVIVILVQLHMRT